MIPEVYKMDIQQALDALGANASIGLMEKEAALRLGKSGKSIIKPPKKRPVLLKFFDQLKNPLILLLTAASVTVGITDGLLISTLVIIAIIFTGIIINIIISGSADNALRELVKAAALEARVIREQQVKSIAAREVVAGDIVILGKGDCVPADLRLIESFELFVDETSVTNEPAPVRKDAYAVLESDITAGEKRNLAYMGSIVTSGRGIGVVFAIGMDTLTGKKLKIKGQPEEMPSPLQEKLSSAAKTLGILCVILCAVMLALGIAYDIFEIGLHRGIPEMIVIISALALAAAPGTMAEAATSIMVINTKNMARMNVIFKSLRAALTLGSATVICTNKTGTLTENDMTVTQVADPENVYRVTGVGYKAKGYVEAEIMITRNIALMSEIVVLCNDAAYDKRNAQIEGDPTEGAMLVFGAKLGHDKHVLDEIRPRVHEIPFDSTRKMMSTYNKDGERIIMYSKGAAEEIIRHSSYVYLDGEIVFMSDTVRAKLMAQNERFAAQSLRVLACAYKVYNSRADIDDVEEDLIYVGMMALHNPLREDAHSCIKKCRGAGINVKMVTADQRSTAMTVAQALGIAKSSDEVLTGSDLDIMSDESLRQRVSKVNVFASVTEQQRLRITTALQAGNNSITVVTGKNPEDVISLEKADIGMAIGTDSKDIAKDKADIIINDDGFSGIIGAVEQSRAIYSNVRKAVRYMLTCSISILLLTFFTLATGLPAPLSAVQILLVSLLSGALPVLGIGMEKKEPGVLSRRPRHPEESILNRRVLGSAMSKAIIISVCSMAAFLYGFYVAVAPEASGNRALAQSMCFFTIGVGQLLAAYSSKTDVYMGASKSVLKNRFLNISVMFSLPVIITFLYMPGLNTLTGFIALRTDLIIICLVLAVIMVLCLEISKYHERR